MPKTKLRRTKRVANKHFTKKMRGGDYNLLQSTEPYEIGDDGKSIEKTSATSMVAMGAGVGLLVAVVIGGAMLVKSK